jgi:glycosyltransferase involved in cell wall biosynthesis
MAPAISVIVPVYNGALYIVEAVEAILAQTYPAREIIVVNDGSTDGTATVLARFEGRITLITQANAGVQAARNRGIERACGAWIALCDADDFLGADLSRTSSPAAASSA